MQQLYRSSIFLFLPLFLFSSLAATTSIYAQLNISCPSNVNQNNDPGLCGAVVTYAAPEVSGSGTNITVTRIAGLASGEFFPVGVTTVTFRADNDEGDEDLCSFTVTVVDNEDPVFDCPPNIIVNANEGECTAIVNFDTPTATDNCGVVSVTQIGGLPSGSVFPTGQSSVDFLAVDAAGRNGFCRIVITVVDVTNPTIVCPDDITVNVTDDCSAVVNYTAPVGTDLCTFTTTTRTGGLGSGATFPLGNTVETYTVTDSDDNTASCSFTITVVDVAPPAISCPDDITAAAAPGTCEAVVVFAAASATDNCPGVDVQQTAGPASGSAFPTGVSTITYTATDGSGNTATCSFTITVTENEPPVINCPTDITSDTDPNACEAVVNYTPPTGSDNCPGATTVLISGLGSGAAFPIGTTTETYEVTDASGNTATCSFTVTVVDNETPVLDCPPTINADNDPGTCEATVSFATPSANDNCPGVVVTQTAGPVSGSVFPVGTTTITFTASDAQGNAATCDVEVEVVDIEPPAITCPVDVIVMVPEGDCEAAVTYDLPTFTDNCPSGSVTLISGPASGSVLAVGFYTVTYEAQDEAGNTDQCSFELEVQNTNAPVFDCPGDLLAITDPNECSAVVNFSLPEATDPCTDVTVTQTAGPAPGSTFPLGSTEVSFIAEDEFGNTSTCSFNVVVEDQEAPVIDCPSDAISAVTEPGQCEASVSFSSPSFTDNCPGGSITQTDGAPSGSTFPVGDTVIEFTATDAAGNTSTCEITITVTDEEPPVITCPDDAVVNLPPAECEGSIAYPNPTVSDNCPGVTFSLIAGPASGDVVPAGTYVVTFAATDASGNGTECSFQVTVIETSEPVFDCPDDLVVGTDPGSCDAIVNFPFPTASDPCSDVTVTQTGGPSPGSTFPLGTTPVSFIAEDESGNTATCSFNIVVEDQENPTIDCPEELNFTASEGACEALVEFTIPAFTDNCPGGSIAQTDGPSSGSVLSVGQYLITFTANDAVGNTATCEVEINVLDTEAPSITCPDDVEIVLDESTCEGTITYGEPTVSDNCPGVVFALTEGPASGSKVTAGIYTITYEATDASGNVGFCSFEVTVAETNPPVFDCPGDITVPASAGACEATVSFETPIATDPCTAVTVTQIEGPASGSNFPAGPTTVTFLAEDEFGNTTTCSFIVTVVDDTPPTINCPDNIAQSNDPGECGAVVNYTLPTASDNCGDVSITLVSGPASGDFFALGIAEVSYQATDLSGNAVTCSFTVTIVDDEVPVFDCPTNIEIILPDGDCEGVVNYTIPTASDNCVLVGVEQTQGPVSGATFPVGITTIAYEATDDAGNASACSFTVSLIELVPPTIACPADIELNTDPGECGALVTYSTPEGTDNCPGATTVLTEGLASGSLFPVGTTLVGYTVTDLSGNTATCSFSVTVTDAEAPVFECPEQLEISNTPSTCGALVTYQIPVVTDNCDGAITPTLISGPPSGAFVPVGSTQAVFQAVDAANNMATCEVNIIVVDMEPPTIFCPDNIVIDANAGDCETIATFDAPLATDNCGIASIVQTDGLASGSQFPVGISTVSFQATDLHGNTANCSFTITVSEPVPPTISCPEVPTVNNDPGQCGAVVDYPLPEAFDDCGEVELTLLEGPASGAFFAVGNTTVTYQATDLSGNTASCSFSITVVDIESPFFNCPAETLTLSNDPGICGATYTFNLPVATDNCDAETAVVQTAGPASGSLLPLGLTAFSFQSADASGNIAVCSYEVLVVDNEPPVLSNCSDDVVIGVGDELCEATVSFSAPEVSDNCGATLSQVEGPQSGESLTPGVYTVTYQAIDDAGNAAECSFNITVEDNIAPEFLCPENQESCDNVITFDPPFASDNCSQEVTVIQTSGPASGTSFPLGISTLTFEATDEGGNTAVCTFEIEVLQQAPRAEVGNNRNICGNTTTTLQGSNPGTTAQGTWTLVTGQGQISDPNSPSSTVSNLGVGANLFEWAIDPLNGCEVSRDTVSIFVEPGVTVEAGPDVLLPLGQSEGLSATAAPPGGSWFWQPESGLSCINCPNPVASPLATTQYVVTYTSPLGCSVEDSLIVRVFRDFPNTITPNNDGVNDVWNIPGIQNFPNAEVHIYNRWGTEVFSSVGYTQPWDGTRNGTDLPAGSYFYIIDYKESGIENLNGTVNIIR